MLTHTLEENRKLKELALRMERKVPDKKTSNPFQISPTTSSSKNLLFPQHNLKSSGIEESLRPSKSTTLGLPNEPRQSVSQGSNGGSRYQRLIDDKKGQSILKMSRWRFEDE